MQCLYSKFLRIILFAASLSNGLFAGIIAEFPEDFDINEPENGWAYYWNPEGVEIGDHQNYERLKPGAGKWWFNADPNGHAGYSSNLPNGAWVQVTEAGSIFSGSPAKESTDGLEHYVILAYTLQEGEAGNARVTQSHIQRANEAYSSEIRVYINDDFIGSDILNGDEAYQFDIELGQLNVGDTIYLVYGSNNYAPIRARLRFKYESY